MKMNFENWYNKILVENETAVKAEITTAQADHSITSTASSREDIISDVDSIMTQLDQLSAQVKEDFNIEILDESLITEGAWDDTKSSFGDLFSDPVFQLVGLGLAGIIGALGLGVKAVKDTKRNGAIGKQVMGDYAKLKQLKLQAVKLEAIQHQLEEKKDEIEAEGGAKKSQFESTEILSEGEPKTKAPLNNVQKIAAAKAEKEKAAKMQAAQAKKDAADAKKAQATQKNEPTDKTTTDDENAAKQKMREKIEAQIAAIAKKRDTLDNSINTFEQALDAKYDPEKITGFGSKKVHTLIASAKDGIAQEVAEAKLKFFGETLSDEAKKELQDSLAAINKRSAERKAEIDKEAKENAEKAKEIADKDEEVKKALEDMKKKKENPSAETDKPQTSDSPETKDKSSGPSDAEKDALATQDDQKNKAEKSSSSSTKEKPKKDKPKTRRQEVEDQIDKDNAEPVKITNDPNYKKEEPKKEEPKKAEKPKKEEPKKEEPKKAEEPKKEEPKKEEPKKAEEPKKEEPKKAEEPKKEEPKKEDPSWDKYEEPEIAKGKSSWDGMQGAGWGNKKDNKEPEKSSWDNKEEPTKDTIQKAKDAQAAAKAKVDKDSKEKSEENDKAKEDKKKKSAKEALVISATELGLNELASEIDNKLDWQFENNSALYIKYKTQIVKASFDKKINEAKYSSLSVSDKMKLLLG